MRPYTSIIHTWSMDYLCITRLQLWESYIVISRTRTPVRPHFHYGPIKWSHKMQFVFVADGGFVLSYAMPWLHFAINWQKIQNANYAITLGPNGRTDVALGRRMPPPPLWASQCDAQGHFRTKTLQIFFWMFGHLKNHVKRHQWVENM